MKYAVTIITRPGYVHSECFREVAETIHYGLQALGHRSILTSEGFFGTRRHIVLGVNLLPYCGTSIPPGSILYNLEQVKNNDVWLTPQLIFLLKHHSVWDYSSENILELGRLGVEVQSLLPICYSDKLTRIEHSADQDIDVLFVGSINARRQKILDAMRRRGLNVVQLFESYGKSRDAFIGRSKLLLNMHFYEAKVLEVVRISYYLANRCAVLSEFSANREEDAIYEGGVIFSEYEDLADRACELCKNSALRTAVAQRGFDIVGGRPIEPALELALRANAQARP